MVDYNKFSATTLQALKEGKQPDYASMEASELEELKKLASPKQAAPTPHPLPAPTAREALNDEAASYLESATRGAAQGATFGFADELTGAAEALKDSYDNNSLEKFGDDYSKHRDESREAYRAAEEANPLTSFAGNIAGGMLIPVPGANAALKGAQGVEKAAKLAMIGAGAGALTSAGSSETSATQNPIQLAKESVEGGLVGAAVTPALGMGVPAAAKGLKNWWSGLKSGKDLTNAFKFSKADPNFMSTENAIKVSNDTYNSVEQKLLPMVTDDLQEAASRQYEKGLQEATGTTTSDDLSKMVDDAFNTANPAVKNDPQFLSEREKMKGLVSGLSDEQTTVTNTVTTAQDEAKLQEKLTGRLAQENKRIETGIENDVKKEVASLVENARTSNPKSAATKASEEWFKQEEQKSLVAAFNQATSNAERETNKALTDLLEAHGAQLKKAGLSPAEVTAKLDEVRQKAVPMLSKVRDEKAQKYYGEFLDYYKTQAKPLSRSVETVNEQGEKVLRSEFIDPLGRKRAKIINLSKLEAAAQGVNSADDVAKLSSDIRADKVAAAKDVPPPSIAKEIDPKTGKELMVLRYHLPDGTEVVKPEVIKAAVNSETAKVALKKDMSVEDVLRIKQRATALINNSETSTTKQGNPDVYEAALKLKNAADAKLKAMGVDLDTINSKYKVVSEVAGQTGVDLRGVTPATAPKAKVDAAEKLAKDFISSNKNVSGNEQRRIANTQAILNDSGLVDPAKVEQVFSDVKDLAYKDYLLRTAHNESYLATDAKKYAMGTGVLNARGKALSTAGALGKVTGQAQRGANKVMADMSGAVTRMTPDALLNMAGKVKDSKTAELLKKIATQPEGKRKALIFSMMQTPAYREAIHGIMGDEGE